MAGGDVASRPDHAFDRKIVAKIQVRRVRWKTASRLIPSRYPPIDVFERVAKPEDWQHLYELESLTNPRLRQEAGEISLIPPSRRVSGPGASIVMAPFAHFSKDRPTRFSDGTFGVYYAASRPETALREVAFHLGRFYASTADPPHDETFRMYEGIVDSRLHDLRTGDWTAFLDPDVAKYARPQELGRHLRDTGSNGIVYTSVRHAQGQCVAAFWPDVVGIPRQTKHIMLKWDGQRISAWFDYATGEWTKL